MFVFTFRRQSRIDPILLSSRVVAHVRVTHRRQFTGSRFGDMSGGAGAVNHDISVLLRQEPRSLHRYLIRRQIDCAGQVRVMIGSRRQGLNQTKLVLAINFLFQLVSGNRLHHRGPFYIPKFSLLNFYYSHLQIQPTRTRVRVLCRGD